MPTPTSPPSKLFSHAGREAGYARRDAGVHGTVHRQMRLVGFEAINHALSMLLLIFGFGRCRAVGCGSMGWWGGALAAAAAMALRLNGISHWVMWEMASLFEHVGTVQDGINTSRVRVWWSIARGARLPGGQRAARRFASDGSFNYEAPERKDARPVIEHFRCGSGRAKIGWSGALRAASRPW